MNLRDSSPWGYLKTKSTQQKSYLTLVYWEYIYLFCLRQVTLFLLCPQTHVIPSSSNTSISLHNPFLYFPLLVPFDLTTCSWLPFYSWLQRFPLRCSTYTSIVPVNIFNSEPFFNSIYPFHNWRLYSSVLKSSFWYYLLMNTPQDGKLS